MSIEQEILNGLLSVIKNISNIEYQQKAWVESRVHPYAFFEETMHQLFDDYELGDILNNYKIYGISNEQYHVLNKFYKVLYRYSNEKMSWIKTVNPKEVLEDPKWHEIQIIAKEVLKAFNYQSKAKS